MLPTIRYVPEVKPVKLGKVRVGPLAGASLELDRLIAVSERGGLFLEDAMWSHTVITYMEVLSRD